MAANDESTFRVVIAGGGVAALEAALALRALAGARVSTTILAPDSEFTFRALVVREPFAGPAARRYRLSEITDDIGVQLRCDTFTGLDPEEQLAHTASGEDLPYDALVLALGARPRPAFDHALTLNDHELDQQLQGLVQDVEQGYARRLAFIAPERMPWPMPLYELALMTARRAFEMDESVEITIVTPESSPLALFGSAASTAVSKVLKDAGVSTIVETRCETPAQNQVLLHPGGRTLTFDRVIAMPELVVPPVAGLPQQDPNGFIPVDGHCRVVGLQNVFAAGDATNFQIKHGGIAAQQADVAAAAIAALAGADVEPVEFRPVVHGILLGGEHPLHLTAFMSDDAGATSEVGTQPSWSPADKIAARYLAPYLETLEPAGVR